MLFLETIIFLLFSTLTGFIEIGSVIFAVNSLFTINQIIILVLFYQIGCFFPVNIKLSKNIIYFFAVLCIIFYMYMLINGVEYFLVLISTLLNSICLQTVRNLQKSNISTYLKRIFRIFGFAISPNFSVLIMFIFSIIIFIGCYKSTIKQINAISFEKIRFPYHIMIIHQMHYFSYYSIILIVFMKIDQYQGYFTSFIFVLGWVTYTITPYFLTKRKYEAYFMYGHIFLFIILLSMFFITNTNIRIILWILSGFGGGTVFCIEKIFIHRSIYKKTSMDTSENIGHLLGLFSCFLINNLFSSIDSTIFISAIYALITASMMLIYIKKFKVLKDND